MAKPARRIVQANFLNGRRNAARAFLQVGRRHGRQAISSVPVNVGRRKRADFRLCRKTSIRVVRRGLRL